MESLIYKEKRTEKILKNERKKRIHAKKKKSKKTEHGWEAYKTSRVSTQLLHTQYTQQSSNVQKLRYSIEQLSSLQKLHKYIRKQDYNYLSSSLNVKQIFYETASGRRLQDQLGLPSSLKLCV